MKTLADREHSCAKGNVHIHVYSKKAKKYSVILYTKMDTYIPYLINMHDMKQVRDIKYDVRTNLKRKGCMQEMSRLDLAEIRFRSAI
jgi:uncharacterized protein YlbG (UPF0298 family)